LFIVVGKEIHRSNIGNWERIGIGPNKARLPKTDQPVTAGDSDIDL
jgi:hypothetical protein